MMRDKTISEQAANIHRPDIERTEVALVAVGEWSLDGYNILTIQISERHVRH